MTVGPEEELTIPENIAGPFLRERILRERGFRHAGVQVASVLFYRDGGHSVITSQGADHAHRPSRWARPTSVCEIARGRHVTTFDVELPALGAATFFETRVQLRWEVTDYRLVAEKRLSSVEEDLGPEIVDRLQDVSCRYAVHHAQEANRAVRSEITAGKWADLGREVGLRTRMFVQVSTDRTHIDFVAGARSDDADAQRVALRFQGFAAIAQGTDAEKYAYLMASGNGQEVAQLVKTMIESQADEQRENRDFLVRMAREGRVSTPELDAYIRRLALPEQSYDSYGYRARGDYGAPAALPPAPAGPGRGADRVPALEPARPGPPADPEQRPGGRQWAHDTHRPAPEPAHSAGHPEPRAEEDDWWGEPEEPAGHRTAPEPAAVPAVAGTASRPRPPEDEEDDFWSDGPADGSWDPGARPPGRERHGGGR
ncbi:hypothetical protein ACF052_02745 [Streptomyces pilosus]|uniref:hypothetical protein n=1 Tax=Streptomyces pilosus TaxID=28893 RepID=UPI003702E315